MNDNAAEHDENIDENINATLRDLTAADSELSEADKQKAHDELVRALTKNMPGFAVVHGQIKVKDQKKALHSLVRALCSDRIQMSAMRAQIYEQSKLLEQLQNAHVTLGRNDVLIQTIAANVIYEINGRGDQWEKSIAAFMSMEEVDRDTAGAVELHISASNELVVYGQKIVDGEIEYVEIPRQFLDGIQFHAIQTYMRKQDVRIPKGESIYLLFEGSEEMLDVIPDDFVPVDERLKDAEEAVRETTELYEDEAVIQHASTPTLEERAKALFPDGVDADGDPVDLDLVEAAENVHVRKMDE